MNNKKIGISPQRLAILKQIKAPIRVFFGYDEKEEIEACRKRDEPFLYGDHAYFDRGYERGNFRLIYNTIHQTRELDLPSDRRELFKIKISDWRETGKRIVFIPAPPNPLWFHKDLKWNDDYLHKLRQVTDREIFVKSEKTKGLGDSINKCYALVSHSSVAAVEAALSGVPVICPDTCPAYPIGNDLTQINALQTPNRDKWVNTLTYSQFKLEELKNGTAWQIIKEMNNL
jgi:hypothetical protein